MSATLIFNYNGYLFIHFEFTKRCGLYFTRIIQYGSRLSSYILDQAGASADLVNRAKALDKQASTSRKSKSNTFVI